ncbi:MAG: DsrE/DsrF/DrsH-like family protein [Gemmatimonadota bacterium]|nr:DsrE/DsrF/DrsH-like family protein [Gemmatimonadota bacterium]
MTTVLEQQTTGLAAGESEQEVTRKVAIICSKGSLDMAYPGLIMANAARMMGMDATIFFTFWGMDIINKKKVDHLHAGLLGNPSSPMPHSIMGLPGMEALATKMMVKKMEELDIPPVSELLEILDDAGAELYACQLAMEMFNLSTDDLVPQVKESITAMDFWEKAEGAQIVFI